MILRRYWEECWDDQNIVNKIQLTIRINLTIMRSFWRHTSIWCTQIKRFAQLLYHLRCRTKQHNENLIPFEVQNGLIIYLMIFFFVRKQRFFFIERRIQHRNNDDYYTLDRALGIRKIIKIKREKKKQMHKSFSGTDWFCFNS